MFYVTLSFDNGPDPAATPEVLAVLRDHGVWASFFAVGQSALAEPGGVALAEARLAGWARSDRQPHTRSHTVPLGQNDMPDLVEAELVTTQRLIEPFRHAHRWFRPFGGGGNLDRRLLNKAVVDYLAAGRFSCVLWNAIPRDWENPDGWVETALRQCAAQRWSLMVLHDLPTGAMRHLPRASWKGCVPRAGGSGRTSPGLCAGCSTAGPCADLAPFTATADALS